MLRIKTYNRISVQGLDRFSREGYEVGSDIAHPDAILLRSHKLHDETLPSTLKAIARAGAGVNNVPVEQCSKQGIVVFNTPGANANAVKELVLCGLLLGSRGIVSGLEYVESLTSMNDAGEMGALLEKEKKNYAGNELYGKKLGVVGLGAIGSMVAETALAMGMDVLGYDPALSVEAAWRLPNQVQRMENLQSLLSKSDYISLHIPAIPATKHLINTDTLSYVKDGAVLLNFARDAIVDAQAVVASLDAKGKLKQYICDFPEPCLLGRSDVLAMPHIGASTREAEDNCAVMAANQLQDYLQNGNIKNSVNFPAIQMDRDPGTFRITFANDNVSGVLGTVLGVLAKYEANVADMVNKSRGDIAYNIIDVEQRPSDELVSALHDLEHVVSVRVID
ncbi:MAG: 3-phosphoglycerate dehydrogenase [Alteromonadaceae bacterium]|nr:3-phosphoglycerate dehydrogenase [Alteromonadaceae bacterium]